MREAALFVAMLAFVLALGAGLAHAYELPNKMRLSRDEYFIAQKAYRGWALLGFVVLVQLASTGTVALLYRGVDGIAGASLFALLTIIAGQLIFWIVTFPVNRMTEQWNRMPVNWEQLRRRWEYSHLSSALFQLAGFAALAWAAANG